MNTLNEPMAKKVLKIISGGQTGVDRGALEAAKICGFESGGWCPLGRRAEDGTIPPEYNLTELTSSIYERRTERNVIESGATLILCRGDVSGGTENTREIAERADIPYLVLNPDHNDSLTDARKWIKCVNPAVLNVAGPRESKDPGIQELVRNWMVQLLSDL